MKELIKEYQSVLITSITCIFVFICVYTLVPQVANKAVESKADEPLLNFTKENNDEYDIKINYPKGNKIRLIKGEQFIIGEYITISDKNYGVINNFDYTLNVNGKKVNYFDTNTCGGFYIYTNIIYRNTIMQGELLVIIEER